MRLPLYVWLPVEGCVCYFLFPLLILFFLSDKVLCAVARHVSSGKSIADAVLFGILPVIIVTTATQVRNFCMVCVCVYSLIV